MCNNIKSCRQSVNIDSVTVLSLVSSEAEQTAPPETAPEGEENAPASSENK